MKKTSLFLLPLLAAACLTAQAQTAPAAPEAAASAPAETSFMSAVTGNINVTSNYKFRGQDQGTLKPWSPAVQGGFDWSGLGGFYVGNWNSNVSFGGNIEMDIYGGYKGEIVKDVGYDVGLLTYYYPHNSGTTSINYNTTEIYAAVSYAFVSMKYSFTVSPDYFGLGATNKSTEGLTSRPMGSNTGYLDLSANYEVIKGLTLNGHVGYTMLSSGLKNAVVMTGATSTTNPYVNYVDWKAGATYDLGSGFSAAGAVVGASNKSTWGPANTTRFVATLSKVL